MHLHLIIYGGVGCMRTSQQIKHRKTEYIK